MPPHTPARHVRRLGSVPALGAGAHELRECTVLRAPNSRRRARASARGSSAKRHGHGHTQRREGAAGALEPSPVSASRSDAGSDASSHSDCFPAGVAAPAAGMFDERVSTDPMGTLERKRRQQGREQTAAGSWQQQGQTAVATAMGRRRHTVGQAAAPQRRELVTRLGGAPAPRRPRAPGTRACGWRRAPRAAAASCRAKERNARHGSAPPVAAPGHTGGCGGDVDGLAAPDAAAGCRRGAVRGGAGGKRVPVRLRAPARRRHGGAVPPAVPHAPADGPFGRGAAGQRDL